MRTLNSNFSDILEKTPEVSRFFVFKIDGKAKTSPFNVESKYFSSKYMTIGSDFVNGTVMGSPEFKFNVDFEELKYTAGGITVEMTGEFLEFLETYDYETQEISVYLCLEGITDLSHCPTIYKGIIKSVKPSIGSVTLEVDAYYGESKIKIPDRVLDNATYRNLVGFDAQDKVVPLIYGDHAFYFGVDGTSFSNLQASVKHNMSRMVFVGRDADYYYFIVSDNALEFSNTTNRRVWGWDSRLNSYVMIEPTDVDISVSGGLTICKIDDQFKAYAFIYGDSASFSARWSSEENSVDKDWDTYSSCVIVDGDEVDTTFTLTITPQKIDLDHDLVDQRKIHIRTDFETTQGTAGFTFISGDGIDGITSQNIDSNLSTRLYEYTDNRNSFTRAELFETAVFRHTVVDVETESDAYVYGVVYEFRYQPEEMFESVYCACNGKTDTGVLIEHPCDALTDLIENELSYDIVDSTSFSAVETELSGYEASFVLSERVNLKELLEKFSKQFRSIFYLSPEGDVKATTIPASPSTDYTFTKNEILNFEIERTSIENLIESKTVKYKYNENAEFTESYEDTRTLFYDTDNEVEIEADLIADDTTAQNIAEYDATDEELKTIIRFKTPDLRGYNDGSTLVVEIEVGDIIEIDSGVDDILKNYGESWDETQFIVTGISYQSGGIKFEAIEL